MTKETERPFTAKISGQREFIKFILTMRGFTLIEFLLYIGILTVVLALACGFLWNIIFGTIKATSHQEVQENGRFILTKMTQEIKKASGVNSPLGGATSTVLSLAMANASLDPTVFDLVDGKLRITSGAHGPYELNSDQVTVNNFQFTDLSYSGTPGTIRVEMTVSHINPDGRIEYEASADFRSTISLVPGGAAP